VLGLRICRCFLYGKARRNLFPFSKPTYALLPPVHTALTVDFPTALCLHCYMKVFVSSLSEFVLKITLKELFLLRCHKVNMFSGGGNRC
jgi:hypothetical protein